MKFLNNILTFLLCISFFDAQSQNPERKLRINDLSFSVGFSYEHFAVSSIQNFNALAPNSKIIKDKNPIVILGDYNNPTNSYAISAGLNLSKAGAPNQIQLITGLIYIISNPLNLTFSEGKTYTIADGTGNYRDSVDIKDYSLKYNTQSLRFDVQSIIRINPKKRFHIFTGIGATAGLTFNNYTSVNKIERYFIRENIGGKMTSGPPITFSTENEIFKNSEAFCFSAYLPFGLNFRLSNNAVLLQKWNLFCEVRPGLNFTTIPEINFKTFVNPMFWVGGGIRYSIN